VEGRGADTISLVEWVLAALETKTSLFVPSFTVFAHSERLHACISCSKGPNGNFDF